MLECFSAVDLKGVVRTVSSYLLTTSISSTEQQTDVEVISIHHIRVVRTSMERTEDCPSDDED